MRKNIANIITFTRIVAALCLIPFKALSTEFFYAYIWCGISDILDGFLARKLNIISSLGSRLDTAADLLLYAIMMIKIEPYLRMYLPKFVWTLIWVVVGLRIAHYLYVGIFYHHLSSRHTILNKITSVMMFLLPFTVKTPYLTAYSLSILAVAYISIFEEATYIMKPKEGEKQ
ncbi:MAG: CDP-alcohol phosphatidyltransferase family protein [Oscillospiraceae bacterium]|nr:CDP-alcohol phosphatidyltransferase family protein [Oscillospiraceae bacterium]MBQ6493280.1 CDP-alcohol phosphatidyltransferase family protein [Erysipelotrichaceae bacterium]